MGTADGRVLIDAALTIRRAVEDDGRIGLAAAVHAGEPRRTAARRAPIPIRLWRSLVGRYFASCSAAKVSSALPPKRRSGA
jgi:hypothetical protein